MRRGWAAVGSALFFAIAPGVVAGAVPWWLTGWRVAQPLPWWTPLPVRSAGAIMVALGAAALVHAFARFVVEGAGTPAPVAPTERLVIGGLYRHVRNPMYLAVLAVIAGQALFFGRSVLFCYAAATGVAMVAFVYGHEQPALRRRFGADYEVYRRAVPGWWPRLSPWRPESGATRGK